MTLDSHVSTTTETLADADNETVAYAFGQSTLGQILVARNARGICALLIGSDRERLATELRKDFPGAQIATADAGLACDVAAVVAMIEDPRRAPDLALDLKGSDFEIKVWQALRAIPAGRTMSYSALAETIGMKGMAREVAEACAANRIAVAVPCHRILRKDGSISGYRWGVHRKRMLLQREGAI
ncbi:MAG TPA: methylated-DNA--[protein]-cysteine S-methyltransferase [Nordella sp.]|nr:methylated-DNA--[protein]-cysteine S-methyltransferase [Nordella sp.]